MRNRGVQKLQNLNFFITNGAKSDYTQKTPSILTEGHIIFKLTWFTFSSGPVHVFLLLSCHLGIFCKLWPDPRSVFRTFEAGADVSRLFLSDLVPIKRPALTKIWTFTFTTPLVNLSVQDILNVDRNEDLVPERGAVIRIRIKIDPYIFNGFYIQIWVHLYLRILKIFKSQVQMAHFSLPLKKKIPN